MLHFQSLVLMMTGGKLIEKCIKCPLFAPEVGVLVTSDHHQDSHTTPAVLATPGRIGHSIDTRGSRHNYFLMVSKIDGSFRQERIDVSI